MIQNTRRTSSRLQRVLERVILRLQELGEDTDILEHAARDSDYEPSEEVDGTEGTEDSVSVDQNHSESTPGLTSKQISQLPHTVVKKNDSDVCECSICLENLMYREHKRTFVCGHSYHKRCIDKWLTKDKRCPQCRTEITPLAPPSYREVTNNDRILRQIF